MVAHIEELETMDASEIYSKRLNAKVVIFPKEKGKFIFPIADGRIKTPGGDQELRTPTSIRDRPIRGESQRDFRGESAGSPLPLPQDSLPDVGEALNDFWSMSGNFRYRRHVESRVKLYSPKEESFPIPLKYIDVTRTTHTNLDVKQEKRIDDYWNVDGSRDLSDPGTGFTQFTLLSEKPPDGYMWSGERLTKRQATSRPDHLRPELWIKLGRNAKLKEKNKWSDEEPKLDNAGRLRGIFFIDPEEKEFKEIIKNARRKLETPMAPAMPCKTSKKSKHGKPAAKPMSSSLSLRVSWTPVNPPDCVWENLYRNIMRTILQEKGTIQFSITIWYTNLFLCLKPWRYLQQKQQWIKNGRNLKRFRRGTWQKSEVSQRLSMKQEKKVAKCTSPHWWTSVIWSMPNWRQSTKNTKVELYSEATLWKMIQALMHIKGHGYHIQTARFRRTSSWRSIC